MRSNGRGLSTNAFLFRRDDLTFAEAVVCLAAVNALAPILARTQIAFFRYVAAHVWNGDVLQHPFRYHRNESFTFILNGDSHVADQVSALPRSDLFAPGMWRPEVSSSSFPSFVR